MLSKDVEFLSITADIWTSKARESYLSVTLHYIDNNWEMTSFALGTFPLTESHTGESIQCWIKDLLKEFNVDSNKVVSFVHDNGSNIDLATRLLENELGWFSMGCADHTLQLCVNAGLKVNRSVDQTIAAACHHVTHFRKMNYL